MSVRTIIVTCVPVFWALHLVLTAAKKTSGNKDGYCPDLLLDNGTTLDVGCFDYYLDTFHPDTPESINTSYSFYTSGNASKPLRRWAYDESFVNETTELMNNRSYLTFIIHGFTADADADWVYNMTRVLLHQSEPEQRNVITVDWRSGAEGPNYVQASLNIFMVGRLTAELIRRLHLIYNLDPKLMHIIGHSLGGQTMGQITEWLYTQYGMKIGRATGLDVAAPGFEGLDVYPNKSTADFLEIVHTSSGNDPIRGKLGLQDNFGHVDLYPNGGIVPQPGCPQPPMDIGCSHSIAKSFYIDILVNCVLNCRYVGYNCKTREDAIRMTCSGPKRDICKYIEYLRKHADDRTEEIVYLDTTTQNTPDRCASGWGHNRLGLLQRFFASLLKFLYWSLGLLTGNTT